MSSTEDNSTFIFDGDYEENTYPEYFDDNFRCDFLGQDDSSKIEKNPIEENSTPNYLDEIEEPQKPNTEAHKTSKLRKKRGRKPKIDDENSKKHSNDYRDNIVYKIKSHFHSFIIKYLNLILSIAGVEGEFSNFYGKFQKDITRTTNSKLLDLPISEILKNIPNTKKKKNSFLNEKLYESVKDNLTLKPLFSLTYKEFYLKYISQKPDEVISNNKNIENSEYLKKTDIDKKKLGKVLKTFITNFDSIPKKPKKESEIYKILFNNTNKKFI
jgi:hypothetical protein